MAGKERRRYRRCTDEDCAAQRAHRRSAERAHGKVGNALVPAMQELSKVGVQSNEEFDALTKQINETKDRIELLDRQMNVLAMQGGKTFLEAVATMKQGLVDLTGWFLRTAEA